MIYMLARTMLILVICSVGYLMGATANSFPMTTKICDRGQTCETIETCDWVKNKYEEIKNARTKQIRRTGINLLKDAVCNKDEKAFCCSGSNDDTSASPGSNDDTSGSFLPSGDDDTSGSFLPSGDQCGGEGDALNVIGGEDTMPGEFPFLAVIGYRGKCWRKKCINCERRRVRCIKYLCGGTLINRRYVLTAAHCHTSEDNMQIRQVVLGEWELNINPDCRRGPSTLSEQLSGKCLTDPMPKSQKFKIDRSDVKIHPKFKQGSTVVNDIALVRLPRLAELNAGTRLVCLPFGEDAPSKLGIPNLTTGLLSTSPTVVGWGYTKYHPFGGDCQDGFCEGKGNVASPKQKKLSHGLLRNSDCGRFPLEDTQMCGAGSKGHGACKGDSGSGLFLNGSIYGEPWYQVGIVSYGYQYCDAGQPTVYTRISTFLPWIKQNIKP